MSNTPYDGGRWVTDGGWWVTDGGWCVADGGWCVTDGGWWVATKHQRVDAIVKKKKQRERPYGTPWPIVLPPHLPGLGLRCGLLGSGLYRQVTLHYELGWVRGVHAVFHVGSAGGGGGGGTPLT